MSEKWLKMANFCPANSPVEYNLCTCTNIRNLDSLNVRKMIQSQCTPEALKLLVFLGPTEKFIVTGPHYPESGIFSGTHFHRQRL